MQNDKFSKHKDKILKKNPKNYTQNVFVFHNQNLSPQGTLKTIVSSFLYNSMDPKKPYNIKWVKHLKYPLKPI